MTRRAMKMAELSRLAGVPRETIHYYLREGLLPAPERTGKTQALYDESHLERLRLIRRLREEKYLPVAVIRSVLRAGLEHPGARDLETLVDVLRLDPHLGTPPPRAFLADEEVRRVADELGLVALAEAADDPSVSRVLSTVADALALSGSARELTLGDLGASAPFVQRLVEAEARVFFDWVIEHGDMGEAVQALRAGRGAVARFLTSYRDLMLRHMVADLLQAIGGASERIESGRALPLGVELARSLGVDAHRAALLARAKKGDPAAANDLVWFSFALGSRAELVRLPASVTALLRPRARLLVLHASSERELAAQPPELAESSVGFPLGEVLRAERALRHALAAGGGEILEAVVPALFSLFRCDPGADADPLASALAFLRRGLLGLALPRALGRAPGARRDLEAALAVVRSAPGRIHPAAHLGIEGNARLGLARCLWASGEEAEALREAKRVRDLDSKGPLGAAAESVGESVGPEFLPVASPPR
ncbi:MAG: MerR family transcriptional regulator [Polyangiaceae bacterium]